MATPRSQRSSVVQVHRTQDGVLRVEDGAVQRMSVTNPYIGNEIHEARAAANKEHEMSVRDAIKLYKKGMAYSILLSMAVVMEGYDLSVVGSFFGFPAFKNKYGTEPDPTDGGKLISAPWQTGLLNGVQVGEIIGLYLNGYISEKVGYKKTMIGSMVLMILFLFLPFFAPNIQTLLAGEILQGIPWGVFQTLSTTYASEVMPTCLRAYLTTYVNLCWVFGQLIGAGVLRGFLERTDQWAYRIPFALQWIWPVPILIGMIFAPESPWWLVRHGRSEDAKKALLQLTSRNCGVPFNADDQVTLMKATNELEAALTEGTTYWDCFKGIDLRRTEIASMSWLTQSWCGTVLTSYAVQFYERAGLNAEHTFDLNLGNSGMAAVGTIGSWFLMTYVGRRKLYLAGLMVMFNFSMVIGGLGTKPKSASISWAIGSLMLVSTFVYGFTIGPVCYSLVAEIPSTRLKIKTVVLARNFYNMGGIIDNILMPRMIGVNSWNWGAKSGFFWAGACFLLTIWAYFRLPEPKGRTYGELDVLFEHKVAARDFAKTRVDQFAGQTTEIIGSDTANEEKPKLELVE